MTACIELTREAAEKCLQAGKLKVGWAKCSTRSFTEREGCYRCGKQGHGVAACRLKENERACYKCGQVGHIAKECDRRAQEGEQARRRTRPPPQREWAENGSGGERLK